MSILEDSLKHFFFAEAKSNHSTPRCACAARGKYDFKGVAMSLFRENTWVEGRYIYNRATLVCCVCSYEKFSGTPTNKEPVIMNIEQKVTHA